MGFLGRSRAAVVAAVLLAWLILFGAVLTGERTFAFRDSAHYYFPLFSWARKEWSAGRVPLWNSQENCGSPAVAEAASSTFYPGKLLFLLPGPPALPYNLYVALHVLVAAAAAYLLARGLRASVAGAGIAALSYAFGGNVLFQHCNVVFLVGAAWLPLAVLGGERLLRTRRPRWGVLLAVALALMTLGGDPQGAYHAGLLVAGYGVLLWFRRRRSGHRAAGRGRPSPGDAKLWRIPLQSRFVLLAGSAGLALALAAVQVLPSASWTRRSERAAFDQPRSLYEAGGELFRQAQTPLASEKPPGAGPAIGLPGRAAGEPSRWQRVGRGLFGRPQPGSHHEHVFQFSVAPWRLPELVWPNFCGRLFPTHRRWITLIPAEGRVWNPSLYVGLLPLVLAATRLRPWSRRVRERWLTWAVLLALLAALGWYGLGWVLAEAQAAWRGGPPGRSTLGPQVGGLYWLMTVLLPGYVYFRFPAKLLVVVSLGLSVLAAWGWDRGAETAWRAARRALKVLATISASGFLALLAARPFLVAWWQGGPADPIFGPLDADGAWYDLAASLLQATLLSGLFCLLLRHRAGGIVRRLGAIVLAITASDLVVAHAWSVPTAPVALWRERPEVVERLPGSAKLQPETPAVPFRVYRGTSGGWRPRRWQRESHADRLEQLIRWERETLFPKYALLADVPLAEAPGTIASADFQALLRVARERGFRRPDEVSEPHPDVLRALATGYLLLPAGSAPPDAIGPAAFRFGQEPGPRVADETELWRLERPGRRAWIVDARLVEWMPPLRRPGRSQLEARARDIYFPAGRPRDLRRQAVVEAPRRETPWLEHARAVIGGEQEDRGARDAGGNGGMQRSLAGSCRLLHDSPQRVVIAARLNRPGLLVLSDLYTEDWQAYRLGDAQSPVSFPVLRTNRVLRGVWLPAGRWQVAFVYRPRRFYLGAVVSGTAWLVLLSVGAAAACRRPHRRVKWTLGRRTR